MPTNNVRHQIDQLDSYITCTARQLIRFTITALDCILKFKRKKNAISDFKQTPWKKTKSPNREGYMINLCINKRIYEYRTKPERVRQQNQQ